MRIGLVALAVVAPLLLGPASAASAVRGTSASLPASPSAHRPCGVLAAPRRYRHVIWIWMENHSYGSIIGSRAAPYVNSLAARCGLATNYHNISHPSLPNYVGGTSGLGFTSLQKFTPDCDPTTGCRTDAPSIFSQGETWKAYEESMPAACGAGNSGEYAVRHNPPPYYSALTGYSGSDPETTGWPITFPRSLTAPSTRTVPRQSSSPGMRGRAARPGTAPPTPSTSAATSLPS
jgi:hypothetical protein